MSPASRTTRTSRLASAVDVLRYRGGRLARRLSEPDGHGRDALVAFGALSVVDLLATAGTPTVVRRAAKPLLAPALAAHVLRRRRDRDEPVPVALVAGLGCSAVGDTALLWQRHQSAFLLGMAAFLGTQVSYTATHLRGGAVAGIRAHPRRALGCLAVWAGANAVIQPGLDRRLRLPVAGYSLALAVMGATALGVGGKVAVGGAAFVGSDTLIGLQAAGIEFPSQEVLIMAGYLLGQYLIVSGTLERRDADG
ncbi:lysoplasmalogenase [Streptomyces sp. NPDC005438]|uniref:lysoplasmalogenase n=1 Tax=Streptomyces sp. NPDC005438 TaxID=3156880 RepID=UPI0033A436EB